LRPAAFSTAASGTPVHLPLLQRPWAGARLPEHSKPNITSPFGIFFSSSSVKLLGVATRPPT
jgi:hypothetical protein